VSQTDASVIQPKIGKSESADMSKYGITKKSVDVFYFGDYRYTNLRDAVAEAKRSDKA